VETSPSSQCREVERRKTMEAHETRWLYEAEGVGRGRGAGESPIPPGGYRDSVRVGRSDSSRHAAAEKALVGDRTLGRNLRRGSSLGRPKRRSPKVPQGAPSIMTHITRKSPDPWVSVSGDPRSTSRYPSRFLGTPNKNGHMSAEALKMALVKGGHSHVSVLILLGHAKK
jgi:hypothetical protein